MTYSKPEIVVLGDAARVIESQQEQKGSIFQETVPAGSTLRVDDPAYDLDE